MTDTNKRVGLFKTYLPQVGGMCGDILFTVGHANNFSSLEL